jgi:hypothetical protein
MANYLSAIKLLCLMGRAGKPVRTSTVNKNRFLEFYVLELLFLDLLSQAVKTYHHHILPTWPLPAASYPGTHLHHLRPTPSQLLPLFSATTRNTPRLVHRKQDGTDYEMQSTK